jgi:hypothetical protein
MSASRLLHPDKQTFISGSWTSVSGHLQTKCSAKRIHSDHHAGPEVKSRSLVDLEPKIRMTLVRDKKLTVDLAKYDVERA